ncbi:MAG: hypothetical protein KF774_08930 [Planctomyces sp.]|nr:hypothetical protein [Planctomyces sp.]
MHRTGTSRQWLPLVICTMTAMVVGLAQQQLISRSTGADSAAPAANSGGGLPPGKQPAFQGWDKPAAVLVLTGEQQAYLEPCGCTENQTGGLARRADLFHQLWARKWPTVAVDVGGDLDGRRLSRDQAMLKLEFFRKALQHMRYSGVALGREELRLGSEKLFELHSLWSSEDDFDLPFLSANVTLLSTRDIGTPLEYRIVEAGGRRFGITSVIGRTRAKDLPETDESLLRIDDPKQSLAGVLPRMKAERPDILVLLAHAEDEESIELAKAFPDFHVVVTAGGPEDPEGKEERIGNTLFVQVGRKGKHTACVAVTGPRERPVLKFELVEMDRHRFGNAPEMTQLMREYQQQIIDQRPDHNFELTFDRQATFVGVDQCKDCHKQAYDVWVKTGHANAFESLKHGRHDEPKESIVDRQYDPECLACHVTGWAPQDALRYRSGFVDFASTPHLAGQQCENCHGPGSRHVELELEFQKSNKMTDALEKARDDVRETRACDDCHDHDNSPNFDYEIYWHGRDGKIAVEHSGVD